MADYTNDEIDAKVCNRFKQTSAGCVEGPARVGPYDVWRVWTQDKNEEYHAHYAVAKGKTLKYHDDFLPFANWAHREFDLDGVDERLLRQVPMLTAGFVVIVFTFLAIFQSLMGQKSDVLPWIVTAIVGGAVGLLFHFKPPKTGHMTEPPGT